MKQPLEPLVTPRLHLRPAVIEDADFILKLYNQADFLRFVGDKGLRDLSGAQKYLTDNYMASYRQHGLGLMLVALQAGDPIGVCGLLKRETLPHPDLGFGFIQEQYGRGYATEAGRAVLQDGVQRLKLKTILAITAPDNKASVNTLQKLGFGPPQRREGENGNPLLQFIYTSERSATPV